MKLFGTELKVLRFLPPSDVNAGARASDSERELKIHLARSHLILNDLTQRKLAEHVGGGLYRRTPKGDEVVQVVKGEYKQCCGLKAQ